MKNSILWCALAFLCMSCNKSIDALIEKSIAPKTNAATYVQYTIKQGEHSADHYMYRAVKTNELKFVVKFDSSAIYQSQTEVNQFDINKLYGFSDNKADHHQYSARFGWNWYNKALHLFAYVYNEGNVVKQELGTIRIGSEVPCSIKIAGNNYVFTVNDLSVSIPRLSATSGAEGYMLYPYFGGDETAPHDVNIQIKSL
jgi:hypothetical protein